MQEGNGRDLPQLAGGRRPELGRRERTKVIHQVGGFKAAHTSAIFFLLLCVRVARPQWTYVGPKSKKWTTVARSTLEKHIYCHTFFVPAGTCPLLLCSGSNMTSMQVDGVSLYFTHVLPHSLARSLSFSPPPPPSGTPRPQKYSYQHCARAGGGCKKRRQRSKSGKRAPWPHSQHDRPHQHQHTANGASAVSSLANNKS